MSNNKPTYTEVLEMINDKFDKLDTKLDRVDDKLDNLTNRVTALETTAKSNTKWLGWAAAGAVTLANFAFDLLK